MEELCGLPTFLGFLRPFSQALIYFIFVTFGSLSRHVLTVLPWKLTS